MDIPQKNIDITIKKRREWVFLILSGIFLGSLAMLNILGISRFIVFASWSQETGLSWGQWGALSFSVAVGVLPYPITFLCTDLLSEFYGRERANRVVWVGLLLNIWVVFILWLGGILPPGPPQKPELKVRTSQASPRAVPLTELQKEVEANKQPDDSRSGPELRVSYEDAKRFTDQQKDYNRDRLFFDIKALAFGAVVASMIAFLAAQFCDVFLYHFWKEWTKGKHLWLRNNGSTLVSQLVDTVSVILITHYYAQALPVKADQPIIGQLAMFIFSGYVFKMTCALIDTIPIYGLVWLLSRYLHINPVADYQTGALPTDEDQKVPIQTIYVPGDDKPSTKVKGDESN
ncbi:MAG: queuosine precursor transporter [Gemmataceae bacterium]